jgi:hypothetical protein
LFCMGLKRHLSLIKIFGPKNEKSKWIFCDITFRGTP